MPGPCSLAALKSQSEAEQQRIVAAGTKRGLLSRVAGAPIALVAGAGRALGAAATQGASRTSDPTQGDTLAEQWVQFLLSQAEREQGALGASGAHGAEGTEAGAASMSKGGSHGFGGSQGSSPLPSPSGGVGGGGGGGAMSGMQRGVPGGPPLPSFMQGQQMEGQPPSVLPQRLPQPQPQPSMAQQQQAWPSQPGAPPSHAATPPTYASPAPSIGSNTAAPAHSVLPLSNQLPLPPQQHWQQQQQPQSEATPPSLFPPPGAGTATTPGFQTAPESAPRASSSGAHPPTLSHPSSQPSTMQALMPVAMAQQPLGAKPDGANGTTVFTSGPAAYANAPSTRGHTLQPYQYQYPHHPSKSAGPLGTTAPGAASGVSSSLSSQQLQQQPVAQQPQARPGFVAHTVPSQPLVPGVGSTDSFSRPPYMSGGGAVGPTTTASAAALQGLGANPPVTAPSLVGNTSVSAPYPTHSAHTQPPTAGASSGSSLGVGAAQSVVPGMAQWPLVGQMPPGASYMPHRPQ